MSYSSRIATSRDKESVSTLCSRAMGEDDYVIEILDKTISAGGLFLALDQNRVIGIANFQKVSSDGSAWLSMARTDPEYRGRRVAGYLQKVIASRARQEGIHELRFLVNSSNTPSIRSALRGGFRPIAETAHASFFLEKTRYGHIKKARVRALSNSETVSIMSGSTYLNKANGYLAYGWHFEKASASRLEELSTNGKAYASADQDSAFLFGCAEDWDPDRYHAEFFILKGTIKRTLEIIKEYGASLKLKSIGTFLPYNKYLIRSALNENSFKVDPWADHGIVFGRKC